MTADEQKQMLSSVLTILLCILFLWSGKKFIWNTEKTPDPNNDPSASVSDTLPLNTTTTSATTTLSAPPPQTDSTAQVPPAQTDLTDTRTGDETGHNERTTTTSAEITTTTTTTTTTAPPANGFAAAPDEYFSDALFIGDSRTVGLANYAPIEGAEYFATVGYATHKFETEKSEVGTYQNITLPTLLASKQYGKIYLMLGINEIGNNRASTLEKYQAIVQKIRATQPNAIIYIEANLHVTYARSSSDAVINNTQINSFNQAIAQLADGQHIFYLDVNPVFDDANGALGADYTRDGVHPYAKYYKNWVEFLTGHVIIK